MNNSVLTLTNYKTVVRALFILLLPLVSFAQSDDCSAPTSLTSSITCVNTSGTLKGAKSTPSFAAHCGNAGSANVWYSFVAQSAYPTITLSSMQSDLDDKPRLQLFSSSCSSSSSLGCVGTDNVTTLSLDVNTVVGGAGLTIGATYYIRVFTNATGTGGNNWGFNICVTDNPLIPPANDVCSSAIAITSSASANCVNTAGTLVGATYTAIAAPGCGVTNRNDVWYRFVAQSASPTITLNTALANPRIQLFSGDCTSGLTSQGCGNGSLSATGLTIGATYFIRVYTDPNVNGIFNICVTDPPANDLCTGAIALNSSTSCNNTSGILNSATSFAATTNACGTSNDVWYSFVAQTPNPIITLSGALANAQAQIMAGNCVGGFTAVGACPTSTTTVASGLTVGTTYYVRVYSTTNATGSFDICITDPPPPPANDDCTGAISLSASSTCAKTIGTLAGATTSGLAVPAPCSGTTVPDVWYRFVPTSVSTTITISDFGANFGGTKQIQLFTGTCAGLTSVTCVTGTGTSVSLTSTTLSPGTTYYVRVFSNSATSPLSNADFSICITANASAQRFGNSYVNITKKTAGGVVENGDILEIRMTVNHTSGTMYNMRYLDNVPTNTEMLTGGSDRISVITNEGLAIQNYTLTSGDDAATYLAAPPAGQHQIRMNLGFGTTVTPPAIPFPPDNSETEFASATGQAVASSHIPRGGGGMLFATSFRVRVTGNVGDVITLGAGKFIYRTSAGGPDIALPTIPYQILISAPMSLCANATGVNMSQEFGGTFGTGTTLNRPTDLAFPIPGYTFVQASSTQAVGDGQYAIVKNLSPRSGINRDADRNPVTTYVYPDQRSNEYRMFNGHWDIDGDHTGTTDAIGNIPQADGVSGGYMLMVNADFIASETYRQTLTNLCPNTYYEFSAWFRNICPTCGASYTGSAYTPRQPGVLPNLTFALDGFDRYNTGEIPYQYVNTNSGGWVKKGFVFITGPSQTSATLSIRNNSQGGGGNDWAMDDITVATCLPSMTYTPTLSPTVCASNPIDINNTMRSYFSNYNHYKWQRSTDGGNTWVDIPGQTGSATPTLVGGQWEYATSYTIPPAYTTTANNGDRYRQIVATTSANLSGSTCQATDGVSVISLNVLPDCIVLRTDLLSFNGNLHNNNAHLSWTTSKEEEQFQFAIEKSTDGIHFNRIGTVSSYNAPHAETNFYSFTDAEGLSGMAYYRIAMIDKANKTKYSRTIRLGNKVENFSVSVATNPFDKYLSFDVTVEKDAKIDVLLLDATGNRVRKKTYIAHAGLTNFNIQNTDDLTPGTYILQVHNQDKSLSKKLIKK